jgi:hypothetical protein
MIPDYQLVQEDTVQQCLFTRFYPETWPMSSTYCDNKKDEVALYLDRVLIFCFRRVEVTTDRRSF